MFTIIGADGKAYGPATADKVREWIAGGRANLQTRAQRAGDAEWKALGDFAEFAMTPEPPPPVATPVAFPAVAMPEEQPAAAEPPLASLGLRFAGALLDGIAIALCRLPATVFIFQRMFHLMETGEQPSLQTMMTIAAEGMTRSYPFLIALAVLQACLLGLRSQSLGKVLVRTRIVRAESGEPAGFVHAFLLRGTIPFIIGLIPIVGFLFWIVDVSFIFREDRRCVHDLIAGTKVIKLP